MSTYIPSADPALETTCNQLFIVKEQQQELRIKEKALKTDLLAQMATDSHKGANGTIEKIKRKPKRIYDRDLLEEQLKKRGIGNKAIEEIINASTRRMNVSEHISVKVKRSK